uniref:Bacteriocin SRCAM 37 n=1 Tax=Paenibacillus polymyxa TaxID=1406 RepID=BCN37_PAEPO|nr:RecName: Full=Bacteriocin SRCAM 37 [Paenibacillus polymyxa]
FVYGNGVTSILVQAQFLVNGQRRFFYTPDK